MISFSFRFVSIQFVQSVVAQLSGKKWTARWNSFRCDSRSNWEVRTDDLKWTKDETKMQKVLSSVMLQVTVLVEVDSHSKWNDFVDEIEYENEYAKLWAVVNGIISLEIQTFLNWLQFAIRWWSMLVLKKMKYNCKQGKMIFNVKTLRSQRGLSSSLDRGHELSKTFLWRRNYAIGEESKPKSPSNPKQLVALSQPIFLSVEWPKL